MKRLTKEEVFELIDSINATQLNFERFRPYHGGSDGPSENAVHEHRRMSRLDSMTKVSFKEMVSVAIDQGHQPGGDIELIIPAIYKVLVGHHDGIYWLE